MLEKKLLISAAVRGRMRAHARRFYPLEACGLLLGPSNALVGGPLRITAFVPAENVAPADSRRIAYRMDPRFLLRVQKEAGARNLAVIGIFHSHPGHPPVPSRRDLQQAWPVYCYVILRVNSDRVGEFMAWVLDRSGKKFVELHTPCRGRSSGPSGS
jgi:proteasome lid subunit RPN8/RPN11